jgi:hypothetical protein
VENLLMLRAYPVDNRTRELFLARDRRASPPIEPVDAAFVTRFA